MKHLIILTHPSPNSLNALFKQTLADHLFEQGHEVEIRDLYEINFNPVLSPEDMTGQRRGEVSPDVKSEQEWILWADNLIVIHPIWWTGAPALFKGYIERVFSYGFAYRYDQGVQKGLLAGKQLVIINTHGKSHQEYEAMGMNTALSLTSDTGIYTYCGFEVRKHFFFDKADKASPETIEEWKSQIKKVFSHSEV